MMSDWVGGSVSGGDDGEPTFSTRFCSRASVFAGAGAIAIAVGVLIAWSGWKSDWLALGWRQSERVIGFVTDVGPQYVKDRRTLRRVSYRYTLRKQQHDGVVVVRESEQLSPGAPVNLIVSVSEPSRSVRAESSIAGPALRQAVAGLIALLGLMNLTLAAKHCLHAK